MVNQKPQHDHYWKIGRGGFKPLLDRAETIRWGLKTPVVKMLFVAVPDPRGYMTVYLWVVKGS